MKKLILYSLAALILIIVAYIGITYYMSFHSVTIHLQGLDKSADVYREILGKDGRPEGSGIKVASLQQSKTISLQAGNYYVTPTTINIDQTNISFVVTNSNVSVTVNPGYSSTYLTSILPAKLPAINAFLTATYPQLSDFTVNPGSLYLDGTWYGTTLVQNAEPGNNGDVYRLVLHYANNKWSVAAMPQLVLTAVANKNVPFSILHELNMQTGYSVTP